MGFGEAGEAAWGLLGFAVADFFLNIPFFLSF